MPAIEMTICTTCRPPGASRELPAHGLTLFEALQDALLAREGDCAQPLGLQLRGLACMSGCSRACTVSFQAPGKFTYYFGDLVADAETAEQLIACAQLYGASADGSLARNERPERLRSGILARLPPLGSGKA
jgi:predicted metal-binding protein